MLFETDFPHPTGLYPKPLDTVEEKMSTLAPSVQRKISSGRTRRSSTGSTPAPSVRA